MADPDSARKYLLASLPIGQWTEASRALSRNPTYIQQYLRRGKPQYLSDADRRILVRLYKLDPDKLRPPVKRARRLGRPPPRPPAGECRRPASLVNAGLAQILLDTPQAAPLLRAFARMSNSDRRAILQLARSIPRAVADTPADTPADTARPVAITV